MPFRALAPEASASANSATSALPRLAAGLLFLNDHADPSITKAYTFALFRYFAALAAIRRLLYLDWLRHDAGSCPKIFTLRINMQIHLSDSNSNAAPRLALGHSLWALTALPQAPEHYVRQMKSHCFESIEIGLTKENADLAIRWKREFDLKIIGQVKIIVRNIPANRIKRNLVISNFETGIFLKSK